MNSPQTHISSVLLHPKRMLQNRKNQKQKSRKHVHQ